MKKILCAVLTAAMLVSAFALCGCAGSDVPVLRVYNWNDYIAEGVVEQFEQQYGCKVIYDKYTQNEDMYTKITAMSGESYDVVVPSDYMIERMINEGLLAELNFANIPNYSLISDNFKGLAFDAENKYSVPYMWGTLGIAYNADMVDEEDLTSWDVLWNEKYSQQILMWDSVRDAMGIGLKSLGYSLNATDPAQITAAKDKLMAQRPLVRAYAGDDMKDSMLNKEAAIATLYSGDAYYIIQESEDQDLGVNLGYALPEGGTNLWFDSMVVLKSSQNKELAEKFINFMCGTDVALANCEYIGYNTPHIEALNKLPAEVRNDPNRYPSDEYLADCEVYVDLGSVSRLYSDAWTAVCVGQ
ncbi:MAG: spermidine/putrescine ABC transporter substrate-binding protein [Clostridia bacterium]|nr:spermidine/putrescine ABC transporter substrate-binding protein [Clostridia bacterium]